MTEYFVNALTVIGRDGSTPPHPLESDLEVNDAHTLQELLTDRLLISG
jgi:hypothetical protein